MKSAQRTSRAFTFIELILVMVILTLMAAAVVPRLGAFGAGRRLANTANRIVQLAQYARTQAIAQGRIYRMNFDPSQCAFWLTADNEDGSFATLNNDYGQRFTADATVKMSVDIAAPITPIDQQNDLTPVGAVQAQAQSYVQFLPSGRADPVRITLADSAGSVITIASESPTELPRVVPPQEGS